MALISKNLRSGVLVAAALAILSLVAASCGGIRTGIPFVDNYFGPKAEGDQPQHFEAELTIQRTEIRPGDPVYVTVSIRNTGDEAITAQNPDAASLAFLALGPGNQGPVKVQPVFSMRESLGQLRDIAPAEPWRRTFVFTTLTREPGDYRLQATYYPAPRGRESEYAPVVSRAATYRVAGQRSVRRDRDGILLKEDAIAVAKHHLGRPTAEAWAFYVLNEEAGFYDWWVTLRIDPKDQKAGEEPLQACFVSPYLGTVVTSRIAKPYVPKEKGEVPQKPSKVPVPLPIPPE